MQWLTRLFPDASSPRDPPDLRRASIQEHLEERTEELIDDGTSREKEAARGDTPRVWNVDVDYRAQPRGLAELALLSKASGPGKVREARMPAAGKGAGICCHRSFSHLAGGIAPNTTAVFSVRNSVLIKTLPYRKSEELVGLWLTAPGAAGLANFSEGLRLSPSMYFTYAEQNRTFQSLGVWTTSTANITGVAQPEQIDTALSPTACSKTPERTACDGTVAFAC